MNAENRTVFAILRDITGDDDVFKVVEADEILALLPADAPAMNKQQLGAAIRELRDTEYVKVKYFTPDEYCLKTEKKELPPEAPAVAPEPATPVVAEAEEKAVVAVEAAAVSRASGRGRKAKEARPAGRLSSLLFGMIGAMIGGGVVTAIAIILQKFLFM